MPDPICDNGVLEGGELCDDGDEEGVGCSDDCTKVDPDYLCLEEGKPCKRVVTCGNGVIEGTEACDDGQGEGKTKDGDGCSADCTKVEAGYSCVKPGEPCVVLPVCGNGTRERGEQCEDGQETPEPGDGCDENCQLEDESGTEWECPPTGPCVEVECGDGVRARTEECDDGDTEDSDGCSSVCEVEEGFTCSKSGCRAICGDGIILGDEECDDDNGQSGDGCSGACRIEPFWNCDQSEPTVCVSEIVCGNGTVDPGEVCDPGGAGGVPVDPTSSCYGPTAASNLACKAFDSGLVNPPVCGNGIVEFQEDCDGATGTFEGCNACQREDGYVCPAPGTCFLIPECGDGILQGNEECDRGMVNGQGCTDCQTDPNWFCSGEPSSCVQSVCGDGLRAPNEQCDDGPGTVGAPGTAVGGDGCSGTCTVESGWVCPPGVPCQPVCGDGILKGNEQCDSTNSAACVNCRLQPGYKCASNGTCSVTVCGNGTAEPGEGCDDGNVIAGDGCGPTCQLEPNVLVGSNPVVQVTCGDGIKTGTEQCDDGNKQSGDGCSSACKREAGWSCTESTSYPDSIDFKIVYRDFKQRSDTGGHPHMKVSGASPPQSGNDFGIVGSLCTAADSTNCGRLDAQGKPTYVGSGTHDTIDPSGDNLSAAYHQEAFRLWYRDTNQTSSGTGTVNDALSESDGNATTNTPIQIDPTPDPMPAAGVDTLRLKRCGNTGNPCDGTTSTTAYQFSNNSNTFYPLGSAATGSTFVERGFGYTPGFANEARRNWHFTSELRYYFQYQGGETLTFFGDDDVWVFVNGRLAVDIGGIHGTVYGRVVLGDENSDCTTPKSTATYSGSAPSACTRSASEVSDATDDRFQITKGNVYEIVVFQAERHPTGSNYQLTLDGFIAPRSTCNTTCGDNVRAGNELCDGTDVPASAHSGCSASCTFEFCGDAIPNGNEDCDNGSNVDLYGTGCAPGCVSPPKCGDGIRNGSEQCDRGPGKNNGGYGGCTSSCQLGPYCGDGNTSNGEECDTPGAFTTYADGPGACNYNCKSAPYCGDGTRNGAEICDGEFGCNAQCEFDPFCGDGLKTSNEACDFGQFGYSGNPEDAPYGGCTDQCQLGPYCGDESIQSDFGEECDDGAANQNNVYDGCTKSCLLGPHCGDAVVQTEGGEDCDNGFNEDEYAYPGSTNACGENCSAVPYCGDGKIQDAFEFCDNGAKNNDSAYDGCTTKCEFGPYCGDGQLSASHEECDDGARNVAYSADGKGCGYDCRPSPYCGDGIRNGPEQCDLGAKNNDGKYGGCKANCSRAPYCGDRKIQKESGEECDDGPNGSLSCTNTCKQRDDIIH